MSDLPLRQRRRGGGRRFDSTLFRRGENRVFGVDQRPAVPRPADPLPVDALTPSATRLPSLFTPEDKQNLAGCFPFRMETYGALSLLGATVFVWLFFTSALVFSFLAGPSLVWSQPWFVMWTALKLAFLLFCLQGLALSVFTFHRRVYSTAISLLQYLTSPRRLAVTVAYAVAGVMITTMLLVRTNHTLPKFMLFLNELRAPVDTYVGNDEQWHLKDGIYDEYICAVDLGFFSQVFHGCASALVMGLTLFYEERNVLWFPEVLRSLVYELPPRLSNTADKAVRTSVVVLVLSVLSKSAVRLAGQEAIEEYILLTFAGGVLPFLPVEDEGLCGTIEFSPDILTDVSFLRLLLVGIFVGFCILSAEEVVRLVVYRMPTLFGDNSINLPLPIFRNALKIYLDNARQCRWSQLPRRGRGSAVGKIDGGDLLASVIRRQDPMMDVLAGASIAAPGSLHHALLNRGLEDAANIRDMSSTHSLWKTLVRYSRDRYQHVLMEQVERDMSHPPCVVRPLGFYQETVRALAFLRLRQFARYDPARLILALFDGSAESSMPWSKDGDELGTSFARWVEIVRVGTAMVDALTLQLQLVCTVRPLVVKTDKSAMLEPTRGSGVVGLSASSVVRRGYNWLAQDVSRRISLKTSYRQYLPCWCRELLWFRYEWQELDPVRTHQRIVKVSEGQTEEAKQGSLRGGSFVRNPSQITKALFADVQILVWVADALTESAAIASTHQGCDGRADAPWTVELQRQLAHSEVDAVALGRQFQDIVLQTIPVILCSLLDCLGCIEEFVASPVFVGGSAPPELEGHQLSRPQVLIINDVLTRSVTRIVTSFYERLGDFGFAPEYAHKIVEFARFKR